MLYIYLYINLYTSDNFIRLKFKHIDGLGSALDLELILWTNDFATLSCDYLRMKIHGMCVMSQQIIYLILQQDKLNKLSR